MEVEAKLAEALRVLEVPCTFSGELPAAIVERVRVLCEPCEGHGVLVGNVSERDTSETGAVARSDLSEEGVQGSGVCEDEVGTAVDEARGFLVDLLGGLEEVDSGWD